MEAIAFRLKPFGRGWLSPPFFLLLRLWVSAVARLPLIGGAYSARWVGSNAQRAINLYPENNPKGISPVPMTHYQRPGLAPLGEQNSSGDFNSDFNSDFLIQISNVPIGLGRGVYTASNGAGYCVIGQGVYSISTNWSLTLLGTLLVTGSGMVSMIDNGTTLLLVDGSVYGYTIVLATNIFALYSDPSGTFTGCTRVDIIDGFIVGNLVGTNIFFSTLNNSITIDPTYVAAKNNYPGNIVTLGVSRRQLLLLGNFKSEIWYDAGNPLFPFAELPGASIEHGCTAPYSWATEDINAYWLGQDLQGAGIVFKQTGYTTNRISNHALENAILTMIKTVGISDAVGYTYQQGGHVFYGLTFPAGNQTWVYDVSIGDPNLAWHQRCWTDGDGNLNRDRIITTANLNGLNVGQDWQYGTLYMLDRDTYTDTVQGVVGNISCIRTFPHILAGMGANPQNPGNGMVEAEGKRVKFNNFIADIEVGDVPLDDSGIASQVFLRVSLDRGKSFGNPVPMSLGTPGQYLTEPKWQVLGIGRDVVFELSYSAVGSVALNGAWVDVHVLNS